MALGHGVRRAADGGVRLRLSVRERELLRALPEQLRPLVSGDDASGAGERVRERLFPPAYDDPLAAAELEDMVGGDLRRERLDALDRFAATLDRGEGRLFWSVELSADEAAAWLAVINDARLTLGVLLGIRDESQWEAGPDRENVSSVLLYYLGWLQEEFVGALMGDLG